MVLDINALLKAAAIVVLPLVAVAILVGCGRGGTPAEDYSGIFAGGQIGLGKDRGGGEIIQIDGPMAVDWVHGNFDTDVVFFYPPSTTNSTLGRMSGSISKQGLVTASIELSDGGKITVGGGPLRFHKIGRGGPDRSLSGPVAVVYQPASGKQVQYLGSTFALWQ